MSEELTREEVHAVVDRAVEELLAQHRFEMPPVDAAALARALGVTGAAPRGARGRADPSPEAKQWLAAQAVGEHLRPLIFRRLGLDPGEHRGLPGESPVTLAAARVLVPTAWFADDGRTLDYDLPELKKRYATAAADLIAWRMLDLSAPCVITVVDNGHVQRRRSNAWRVRRELAPTEQECQRYVNHFSRPRVMCAGGWTVWGWPVHQSDWKREILRSVCDGDDGPPGPDA